MCVCVLQPFNRGCFQCRTGVLVLDGVGLFDDPSTVEIRVYQRHNVLTLFFGRSISMRTKVVWWPPPSNSGKWRFIGIPTKNMILLVVTVTVRGPHPKQRYIKLVLNFGNLELNFREQQTSLPCLERLTQERKGGNISNLPWWNYSKHIRLAFLLLSQHVQFSSIDQLHNNQGLALAVSFVFNHGH